MGIGTVAANITLAAAAATILAAGLNAQTPPRPSASSGSDAVVPFRIQVPDAVLRDLKSRLERARFADEFPDAGWDYGTNLNYIQSLMTYWRDRYDWRAQERRLNRFSQFKTNIGGLDIHFIHQKSNDPAALPLLLLNGWPSSPVEYRQGDRASHQRVEGERGTGRQPSMSSCRPCPDTASRTSRGSAGTTLNAWPRSGRR